MWLNGIALSSIDPKVELLNITEQPPDINVKTAENAKYDGARRLSRNKTTLSVKAEFTIRERDYGRRREIFEEVLSWLGEGGRLEVAYRDGQEIQVDVADYPALDSIREYTKACAIQFTAYDPCWRSIAPTKAFLATRANTAAMATLRPNGTEPATFLEFDIQNTGAGTMNTAAVTVGGRSFSFSALGLAPGRTLSVAYDKDGYLTMLIGAASALGKRDAASADDLILDQRQNNLVTVTTETAAGVTLKARGRWR